MNALQCQHDVDVHLLFCLDIDLHFNLFPSSCITWIFFVDYHGWVPLYKSCIYCNAQMIYTYFVLTSIHCICSCFVHVQQHTPPRISGAEHPCNDRNIYKTCSDCRYSHIADDVIQLLYQLPPPPLPTSFLSKQNLWQPFWQSTHLRCCNIISQRFCNNTCTFV